MLILIAVYLTASAAPFGRRGGLVLRCLLCAVSYLGVDPGAPTAPRAALENSDALVDRNRHHYVSLRGHGELVILDIFCHTLSDYMS